MMHTDSYTYLHRDEFAPGHNSTVLGDRLFPILGLTAVTGWCSVQVQLQTSTLILYVQNVTLLKFTVYTYTCV